MKTTIKLSLAVLAGFLIASGTVAQEFKKAVKSGATLKLERMVEDINIQGHNGNDLIVKTNDYSKPPERADGLKSLYNTLEDNTGIGLVFIENGNNIMLEPANKQAADAVYTIMVPNSIALHVNYQHHMAKDVSIKDFSGEIAVSTLNGDINLENISGPVSIYAINGDAEIVFTKLSQDAPTTIECINGDVDVTLPGNTAADITLGTIHGEAFTNFDIKFEDDKKGIRQVGGSSYEGTINGGGVDLKLSSINSNVYLRKK